MSLAGFSLIDYYKSKLSNYRNINTKPPQRMSVVDWAENNLSFERRVTPFPGELRLRELTPYLCEIVSNFSSTEIEEITLAKSAQIGGTTAFYCMLGYAIDQDPQPCMYVVPNKELANSMSKGRIKPLIDGSKSLQKHKPDNLKFYSNLEMAFDTLTLNIVGSNSPANLASRPVCYLFLDEIDKYKVATTVESSAANLALARTTMYWNRKIIRTSTPTVRYGAIWKTFLSGDQRYFQVPCPNCKEKFVFDFQHFEWPRELQQADGKWSLEEIEYSTFYKCQHCEYKINDGHKYAILKEAEWEPQNQKQNSRHRSYHVWSAYSPVVTFGKIARDYCYAKNTGKPEDMQHFRNAVQGLPWENIKDIADEHTIRNNCAIEFKTIPEEPKAVILAVDVQEDSFFYNIRAWCKDERSYLLRYGVLPSLDMVLKLTNIDFEYVNKGGEIFVYKVTHGVIDSGYRTDGIYKFCTKSGFQPIKGFANNTMAAAYYFTVPAGYSVLSLLHMNSDYYKNTLQLKYVTNQGDPGAWFLPLNIPNAYLFHLTAEALEIKEDAMGREYFRWNRIRKDNHWLDCECMQLVTVQALFPVGGQDGERIINKGIRRPDGRDFGEQVQTK